MGKPSKKKLPVIIGTPENDVKPTKSKPYLTLAAFEADKPFLKHNIVEDKTKDIGRVPMKPPSSVVLRSNFN